jgi:hypothetical protein
MFVCQIHNNTLGKCVEISDEERGVEIIKQWCEESGFILTEEEKDYIGENLSYTHDYDLDNVWTFAIGESEPDEPTKDKTYQQLLDTALNDPLIQKHLGAIENAPHAIRIDNINPKTGDMVVQFHLRSFPFLLVSIAMTDERKMELLGIAKYLGHPDVDCSSIEDAVSLCATVARGSEDVPAQELTIEEGSFVHGVLTEELQDCELKVRLLTDIEVELVQPGEDDGEGKAYGKGTVLEFFVIDHPQFGITGADDKSMLNVQLPDGSIIFCVSDSTYQLPPSGSTVLATPVSSAMICCVRRAINAASSVGNARASS